MLSNRKSVGKKKKARKTLIQPNPKIAKLKGKSRNKSEVTVDMRGFLSAAEQSETVFSNEDDFDETPIHRNHRQDKVKNLLLKAKLDHNFLEAVFGMISFWQFDRKIGTFKCVHSYATPEIVPFSGASKQDRSSQTYLMQSKEGEIFYF